MEHEIEFNKLSEKQPENDGKVCAYIVWGVNGGRRIAYWINGSFYKDVSIINKDEEIQLWYPWHIPTEAQKEEEISSFTGVRTYNHISI